LLGKQRQQASAWGMPGRLSQVVVVKLQIKFAHWSLQAQWWLVPPLAWVRQCLLPSIIKKDRKITIQFFYLKLLLNTFIRKAIFNQSHV
jgi:hypothetical protein